MQSSRIRPASSILFVALLFLGVSVAISLDSGSGKIDVKAVSITCNHLVLSGLLYAPKSADANNPAPAVVLAHGIAGAKEMMSSIGLELARRGVVALCLDLYGHGESQGTVEEGRREPSFGVCAAIQYLKSQPFVNSSALGLIGHSMGAGAIRAAAAQDTQMKAVVLIAGGLGAVVQGSQNGVLNSTYPRNLLIIVGKYDVLFDLKELTTKELPVAFGTRQEVVPDVLYGSFSSQTARKLVVPLTTHLFEIMDSKAVSESVDWMGKAIGEVQDSDNPINAGFVYFQREASIVVALVGLIGMSCVSFFLIGRLVKARAQEELASTGRSPNKKWRGYAVWAVINVVMFVPMFGVGSVISFPPLIFGSSVAWWMLGSGLVGLVLVAKLSRRIFGERIVVKERLAEVFAKDTLVMTAIVFIILFAVTSFLAVVFSFNFRIVSPIFRDFSSTSRAMLFPAFMPFFLLYFIAEGLFLHESAGGTPDTQRAWAELRGYSETVLGKVSPFIGLLFLQYAARIALDIWLLPSFVGFLLEFLWLIVPIFTIASSFSWWFCKRTGNAVSGALLNALLMSWIASVVFPF